MFRRMLSVRRLHSSAPRIPPDPRDTSDFDLLLGFAVGFFMGYTIRK